MVPEQVNCTPSNAKAGRQQAVTGRQPGPNPSLWQLLKDTAGLLLLLGATVLLARVVAVLGRTVDGQRETLAQHRRLSLPPPPPPPADGVRGSKGPGPGAGAALSKKLLREAAPWCVSRTPSYDDSVGTSDEAEPLTREEKQGLQPFCPRPPVGLPCSPSWDLDDADSIAVSESASQQVVQDHAELEQLFRWLESHISRPNLPTISRYAAYHPDEVGAVIQSSFQRKEELLLAMTRRPL